MIQEQIEQVFSKQNKKDIVLVELNQEEWFVNKVMEGLYLVQAYLQKEYEDEIKTERVSRVFKKYEDTDDLKDLIESIFTITSMHTDAIPLVSVASSLNGYFDMMPKIHAIHTMAEILAVLGNVDLYDTFYRKGQIYLRSRVRLSEDTLHELNKLMYLPPMISEPKLINRNRDNYHYSLKPERMILGGKENFHKGDISLDVLNTLSQQALSIDTEFFESCKPTKPEGMPVEDWEVYVAQMNYIYSFINENDLYITHKVDKRGRIYSCGYHFDYQGDDYHKAVLELANKHIIKVD